MHFELIGSLAATAKLVHIAARSSFESCMISEKPDCWTFFETVEFSFFAVTVGISLIENIKKYLEAREIERKFLNREDSLDPLKNNIALWVRSTNDHNTATFRPTHNRLEQMEKINDVFPLILKDINCIQDFTTIIDDLVKKGKNIKILIIHTHGTPNSIRFGNDVLFLKEACLFVRNIDLIKQWSQHLSVEEMTNKTVEHSLTAKKQLFFNFDSLDQKAKIILFACNTGQDEAGIAAEISKLAATKTEARDIIAPTIAVNSDDLIVKKIDSKKADDFPLEFQFIGIQPGSFAKLVGSIFCLSLFVPSKFHDKFLIIPWMLSQPLLSNRTLINLGEKVVNSTRVFRTALIKNQNQIE